MDSKIFNQENFLKLNITSTRIASLCQENIVGELQYSQLLFLADLIKEFANNPIVKTSGVIQLKEY